MTASKKRLWENLEDGYSKNAARIGYWNFIEGMQILERGSVFFYRLVLLSVIFFIFLLFLIPLWMSLSVSVVMFVLAYYLIPVLRVIFLFKEFNIPLYGNINTMLEKTIFPAMRDREVLVREYFEKNFADEKNKDLLTYNILFMSNKKAIAYLRLFISFDDLLMYFNLDYFKNNS